MVKTYLPFFTRWPFESRRFHRSLAVPALRAVICFDQTSLPLVLRTCSLIDAAVDTCRLTLIGLTDVGAGGWTMRRAPTTTACSLEAPVSATEVDGLLAFEVTVSVAFFGPIGSAGWKVTASWQVLFTGTSAVPQVPRSTVKSDVVDVAVRMCSGAVPVLRTVTFCVRSGSPIRRVPKLAGRAIDACAAVWTAMALPFSTTTTSPAWVRRVSVSDFAPAGSGLNATVMEQTPPWPSTAVSQPSVVMPKSTPLASVAG